MESSGAGWPLSPALSLAGLAVTALAVHVVLAVRRHGLVHAWQKSVARKGSFTSSWVHAWAMVSLQAKRDSGASAQQIHYHTNQLYGASLSASVRESPTPTIHPLAPRPPRRLRRSRRRSCFLIPLHPRACLAITLIGGTPLFGCWHACARVRGPARDTRMPVVCVAGWFYRKTGEKHSPEKKRERYQQMRDMYREPG